MLICAKCGKEANLWRSKWTFKDNFPEFYGKRLCSNCITELKAKRLRAETKANTCIYCRRKFGFKNPFKHEWNSKIFHPEWFGKVLHTKCLIQEWKKIPKTCTNCGYYEITKTIYDEDLWSYSNSQCRKFCIALDIVGDEHFSQQAAMAMECSSYINKKEYQKKCLKGEIAKDKERIQIVIDFSSLKDALKEGGIVMTAHKCPNCNGMVDIPEVGKVLICKYCGTSIKPVDIFERIKSLIQ